MADIHESFARPTLHPALRWHREPPRWTVRLAERCLRVEPAAATDFWQKTHDGLEADNGHFLFAEVAGDFVLTVHVGFRPVHQYDQAGLMVRVSPSCWLCFAAATRGSGVAKESGWETSSWLGRSARGCRSRQSHYASVSPQVARSWW